MSRNRLVLLALLSAPVPLLSCGEKAPTGPDAGEEQPTVSTIEVSPAADTLTALGLTRQFSAVAKDAAGNTVSDASVSWLSSDATVATVDGNGLVTGIAAGGVTITATSEGRSGNLALRVVDADLATISELLEYAYLESLVANSDPVVAAALAQTLVDIEAALSEGNLSDMGTALNDAEAILAGSADPHTMVLFTVIELFRHHIARLLNL